MGILSRFLVLSSIFVMMACSPPSSVSLARLQVNYETTPLGIDIGIPQFSWQLQYVGPERGLQQTAYRIVVQNEDGQQVWDSGKVASGQALGISYGGTPLEARVQYEWTLYVWTNNGQEIQASSWFETGLMDADPDLSAWNGATWIGGADEDLVLASHYLSVFRLQYQWQLDKQSNSTRAAFLFGGNDRRLIKKDLNLNGMEVAMDQSYIGLEIDISGLDRGEQAQLHIYRVGYSPEDRQDVPFQSYSIPSNLIHSGNRYDTHEVFLESIYGVVNIYVDGQTEAHRVTVPNGADGFGAGGLNLNPFGNGGDFISFPLLGDIGFRMDPDQKARFSNLQVRHYRRPANTIFTEDLPESIFANQSSGLSLPEEGYQLNGGESGTLVLADPSRNAAPMLRTEFSTENKTVKKARVYATARGIYELYLNGERVGEDYFAPGLTQYNQTHLYQTYDVTDLIRTGGPNAFGAWLSEGWWSGAITFRGENWNYFGDRQSLLAQLVISYEDGTETIVTSNSRDWKLFTDGPIRYGSFFQGEIYDARREEAIDGWSAPGFDDGGWKPAVEVPLEGTSVTGEFSDFLGRPKSLSYEDQQIIAQTGQGVQVVKTLTAQSVEEVRPSVFVYDMGQNMVGIPRIRLRDAERGDTIRLRFAEVRYPDLPEYDGNIDMIMLENIRGALAQDLYMAKGNQETIKPRFTFHGFRFIEITGIDQALPLESVEGLVLSSVQELSSSYETSNPLVNRLWENITWSLRGNFLSIPTDCPARNERMGWNGDINVFSRAATWLTPANNFLRRHLLAIRDMQAENGRFSDVAPVGNGFGGTLWGSAGIVVPWETYQQYGDTSLLAEHYEAMKAYADFLATRQTEDGILNEGPLGDWLSPENAKNDNTLLWTAYQVYDLGILQQVATILGKTEDAKAFEKRYAERKAFFNEVYVDPASGKTVHCGVAVGGFGPPPPNPPAKGDEIDTQASYTIPLALDVFSKENKSKALQHLANAITRKNTDDAGMERPAYSLMTGFIGTASIGQALSENGLDELAYRLLQAETYPSWLYPVKNGATTIWERLNSYTIEDGFGGNNSMNSFNHYAFGAVATWMYNHSLGIQRSPENPGFKHFILRPTPDPDGTMSYAKGHYDSMYGRIVSEWYLEEDGTRYRFRVPPNTSATLHLPATSLEKVRESGKPLNASEGIQPGQEEEDHLVMELSPGSYDFFVKN